MIFCDPPPTHFNVYQFFLQEWLADKLFHMWRYHARHGLGYFKTALMYVYDDYKMANKLL